MRGDIVKALTGRPKKAADALRGGQDYFEEEDDDDALVESATSAHKPRRLCEQEKSKKAEQTAHKRGGGSVVRVSKAKLLEASLMSLETLGRQRRTGVDGSALTDAQVCGALPHRAPSLIGTHTSRPAHPPRRAPTTPGPCTVAVVVLPLALRRHRPRTPTRPRDARRRRRPRPRRKDG